MRIKTKSSITNNLIIVDESQRNEFSTDQHQNKLRQCSSEISTQCDADIKPCHSTEFVEQFKRIERDIESLKNRLEIDEGDEIVLACNTGTCLKEKAQLRNNLESANAKIKDLEAKSELLVCEKKSLTTAIRIIQEDNSQQKDNNCIEKQESPWVKVGDKQLKEKKKKHKHCEAKKSPQRTAAESEENLPQISEETQNVQFNDVSNDQTRDKPKKDNPVNAVGMTTYKSTTSTVSVVGNIY